MHLFPSCPENTYASYTSETITKASVCVLSFIVTVIREQLTPRSHHQVLEYGMRNAVQE